MTPAASILEPNSNLALYVAAVLTLYLDLPDTPLRASVRDQRQARLWFDRGVPLEVVEIALLLACLRRKVRPADVPTLSRIRSLAYFQPVIEELLDHPRPSCSRRLSPVPAPQATEYCRHPRPGHSPKIHGFR